MLSSFYKARRSVYSVLGSFLMCGMTFFGKQLNMVMMYITLKKVLLFVSHRLGKAF